MQHKHREYDLRPCEAQLIRRLALWIAVILCCCSGAVRAQNIEGQIIAAQYGIWRVQGIPQPTTGNAFNFVAQACNQIAGNKTFQPFQVGTPIEIFDADPSLNEAVTPSAISATNQGCSITVTPAHTHNSFSLGSATAGLQEAINANTTTTGNTIVLTAAWFAHGGSTGIITSVQGTTALNLVDVTKAPYDWYQWNGSVYVKINITGANLPHTFDLIAGDNNGNGLAVPELQNAIVGGVSTVACSEDHNKGIWDPRCRGWATNPSTALVNTIQAAMCYDFTNGGPNPVIQLPAGPYSIGGNIQIPPNVDVEGMGGTNYGFLTQLTTNDTSQPMFTQVGSMVFTCNGTPHTDSGAGGTLGNVSLFGGGTAANTDVGLVNAAGSDYIHNISFTNFGGSCRARSGSSSGINSRGSYVFFQSCLQWYYFGGTYNTSGFTDTAVHASLQLDDQDSSWDHVEGLGQLADGGYYNRFLLANVQLGGGPGTRLTNSFIQLAPHNVWVEPDSNGSYLIEGNHFDGAWWSSLELGENGTYSNNIINGYCISPTLNPANFPTNPGGVSTDPNCSAIELEQEALGSILRDNNIGESGAVWPAWPVGSIFATTNVTATIPTTIDQPNNNTIIGYIGGNPGNGNPGADVSQSMHDTSWQLNGNVGTTLHFNFYKHLILSDSVATSYSTFDGLYHDAYVTLQVGSHDTITPSATIATCGNANIVGPQAPIWFYDNGTVLTEFACL